MIMEETRIEETRVEEIRMEETRIDNFKAGNKVLYIASYIVAVVSGSMAGILGAMTAAAASLEDIRGWTEAEMNEFLSHDVVFTDNLGKFAGEHTQADFVSSHMMMTVAAAVVFLAALIVLCVQTGRFHRLEDGSISLNWFDRIWSEVQAACCLAAGAVAVWLAVPMYKVIPFAGLINGFTPYENDAYYLGPSNKVVMILASAGMAACIAAATACFVTLVKKVKAKTILRNTLIFALITLIWKFLGRFLGTAGKTLRAVTVPGDTDKSASLKIKGKYIALAAAILLIPDFFWVFFGEPEMLLLLQLIVLVGAALVINKKVNKLAEIRSGVIEVKSGDLTHRIPVDEDANGPKTNLDKLASDINHISEATNVAVQNEIKNQRLKTDLISNVSHDLKTPLTSMISYLDILEKEGLDSPDAPVHLEVVKEKTERLRTLTEELFEAAKASSGNIPCEITDIDLSALIDQSLAEMGDRLEAKDLTIRKNIRTDNTMVKADGKLLYRVLENLLSNISKYALEGSRVYMDVTERNDRLLLEVKNISRDELNISEEELMERFTRGDQSRNTEGSGLGLAIAKDLTTLMGGVFEINIDGDMFKASVLLNKA